MKFDRDVVSLVNDLEKIDEVVNRINKVKIVNGAVEEEFSPIDYYNYIPQIREIAYAYKRMIETILRETKV